MKERCYLINRGGLVVVPSLKGRELVCTCLKGHIVG